MAIGQLDTALRALEQKIRAYEPRCEFYFGGDFEQHQRAKSPPFVEWFVEGGIPSEPSREIAPSTRFAVVDDQVTITARCAGLVEVPGPDPRRQQHEVSRQVMLAVSLAVHQKHQGYLQDLGWQTAGPALSDAFTAIDYRFQIRAGRWTPALQDVQPTTQEPTVQLEHP